MEKQVLSKEQMQEVIDMGIDVSKASMVIEDFRNLILPNDVRILKTFEERKTLGLLCPAFTLQDILDILPIEIKPFNSRTGMKFFLRIIPYEKDRWVIDYENPYELFRRAEGCTLMEAAFNMLKWCKQNKFIV